MFKINRMLKKVFIFSIIGLALYACATVAVTGRKQLSLVSNAEIIPMSVKQYNDVLKKGPLSSNQEQAAMVNVLV